MFIRLALFVVLFVALNAQAQEVTISQKNRAAAGSNLSLQNVTTHVRNETARIQHAAEAAIISADSLLAKLDAQAGADCPANTHFMKGTGSSGSLACERLVVSTIPLDQDCGGKYCAAQYSDCALVTTRGGRNSRSSMSCTIYDAAKLNADYICRTQGFARAATYTTGTAPTANCAMQGTGRQGQRTVCGILDSPGGTGTQMHTTGTNGNFLPTLSDTILTTVKCTN